ncbi:hypothetical protein PHYC_03371 [Phycisphaerales bacterium]|nr:hypothetical protein PHYC_03371 [Phycisphaerales bacterium]
MSLHAPRVVSLVPAATEIVAFLGCSDLLVGRSHECDFPHSVSDRPVLTAQRVRAEDPKAIDEAVRGLLAVGEPLYTVDEARLRELRPDLILTQDLCAVCSIDLAAVRRIAEGMNPRPAIVSLNPTTVEGVLDDVLTVGRALGKEERGIEAVVELRERLARAQDFVNPYADGPSVAFLEWTDPLFVAGHWTAQLIERAGGRHPLNPTAAMAGAGAGEGFQGAMRVAGKSVRVSIQALVASEPEYAVVCPCGLGLERTAELVGALGEVRWWSELPAVRKGRVALVDGNQMFNRPGPRIVDGFEWLVGWLQGRTELMPAEFPWREVGN